MKSYKILTMALAGVSLASCADLDTAPESAYVTTKQKEETLAANPERALAGVTGISAAMNSYNSIVGTATTEVHSDYGYASVMLWLDSRGTDMVSDNIGYNWYSSAASLHDDASTAYGCRMAWGNLYKQINSCNALIPSIDPETEDDELKFYLAQGLAFRSFDYWALAQSFQFNYKVNPDAPCVPVITELNSDEAAANGCARSTVKETYDQIISDISTAISLLESSSVKASNVIDSKAKRLINLDAAYALRARYYLSMHEYAKAAEDAQKCLSVTSARPYSMDEVSRPTFASIDDNAWLWGIAIAETDRVVTTGICNWPSHLGSLNYGYASVGAWRKIAINLYDAIPDNDVRKGWFLDANGMSRNLSEAQQSYVTNDAGCSPYTQVKFAPYQNVLYQNTNANDIPLLRIEEVYLTLAEAQAMGGDPGSGKATLEQFVRTYRNPTYTCRASGAEDIQAECWNQRRVELWGEGMSYCDIMRLNKGIDRRGGGWQAEWVYNIPAGDPILLFQIPQTEQESNKLAVPNPNATQPQPVTE